MLLHTCALGQCWPQGGSQVIELESNVLFIPFPLPQITCSSAEVSDSSPPTLINLFHSAPLPPNLITVKWGCRRPFLIGYNEPASCPPFKKEKRGMKKSQCHVRKSELSSWKHEIESRHNPQSGNLMTSLYKIFTVTESTLLGY